VWRAERATHNILLKPYLPFYCPPVNDALIAIAQEVAELLKQSCLVQADEIGSIELVADNNSAE
jgi:hypothetical protein